MVDLPSIMKTAVGIKFRCYDSFEANILEVCNLDLIRVSISTKQCDESMKGKLVEGSVRCLENWKYMIIHVSGLVFLVCS